LQNATVVNNFGQEITVQSAKIDLVDRLFAKST